MSEPTTIFDDANARPSRFGPFLFAFTLLAAALLYIATGEMILAVILPCVHGAWNSIRTGIWLFNSDPRRSRARICLIFYIATACWKAAAAALTFIVVMILTGLEPNMKDFIANLLVLFGGIIFNSIFGLVAIGAAVFYKVRIWVHPRLRQQVQGDLRLVASLTPFQIRINYAIFVVATALLVLPVIADVAYFAYLTAGNAIITDTGKIIFMVIVLIGGPICMVPCYAWLSSRIIARSPCECWPAGTV